jgi:3-hydroxybutyryl-CoA dehydratase
METKSISTVSQGEGFQSKTRVGKYQSFYYAGASGDFNMIHIDPEFGKMVGLGGIILQGLCTMAFVAKTCTDWAGSPEALKRIKVRFAGPVRPEDEVIVNGTVASIDENTATAELAAVNQKGDAVITRASAQMELEK